MINSGKINIYLMRHGQTILNRASRTQGWCDGVLTKEGIDVAVNVGLGLRDIKFKNVYSSDLRRAMKTADIVIKESRESGGLEINHLEGLREVYFGGFEGEKESIVFNAILEHIKCTSIEEAEKKYDFQKIFCDTCAVLDPIHEAENYNTAITRVMKSLHDICEKNIDNDECSILIVAHGGIIRLIIDHLDKSFNIRNIDNSSICMLEYENNIFTVKSVNDTSYSRHGEAIRQNENL